MGRFLDFERDDPYRGFGALLCRHRLGIGIAGPRRITWGKAGSRILIVRSEPARLAVKGRRI